MSLWKYILVAHVAIGVTGLIWNAIQFIFIIRRKKIKLAFDLTILSLNVADLIVSICITMLNIYFYLILTSGNNTWYPSVSALAMGFNLSLWSSIWHSVFIAIQRFLATFFPMKFRIYYTRKHCIAGLIIVWISSILQTAFSYVGITIFIHALAFLIIFSDAFLITFYVMICCRVHYKRRLLSSTMASSRHHQNNWTLQYSVLVTSAFVFCTLPYAVMDLRQMVGDPSWSFMYPVEFAVTSSILFLNPALDSVLFFVANYKQKLCCQSLRRSNTLNMSFQCGYCSIACCKRTEVIENTSGSQERRLDCLEMQPINANPPPSIDNIETNV